MTRLVGSLETVLDPKTRRSALDQKKKIADLEADVATATAAVAGLGEWQAWTPTVTQSGSVTVTNTSSRYTRIGDTVHFHALLAVTGSGTGGNAVVVSLPVTAATSGQAIGFGWITDSSAGGPRYTGTAVAASTTTLQLVPDSGVGNYTGNLGAANFTAGLASGDTISVSGTYEAA